MHFPFEFNFENLFNICYSLNLAFLWIVSLYVCTLVIRFPVLFFLLLLLLFLLLLLTFKSSLLVTTWLGITKYFLLTCHLSESYVNGVFYWKYFCFLKFWRFNVLFLKFFTLEVLFKKGVSCIITHICRHSALFKIQHFGL